MATRTAAQNGLWSDTTTWGGTVPANTDAFNIPAGIVVLCDVDQSGMANGMAASVIDGLLHFDADTNTCLKMNGNITGTGALYICERATVTGFTLTTGKTNTYQVARTLDVATVEDTLGAGYLDAVEELIETAIDVENAARVAQGLNEMMPDAVQTFIETTRAGLTLSQILAYVEATQGSFYHDPVNDVLYIHCSDSADPSTHTMTVIEPINRPAAGSEYRCYNLWNSTGIIAMTGTPIIRAYGWYPEREWTQLSADAAAGQNQIVLEHDLDLQEGSTLSIGSGTENGVTVESNKGKYGVTSYNSETKTVTLSSNLQTARLVGDVVLISSCPIKFTRTSGNGGFVNTVNEGVVVGVRFVKYLLQGVYTNGESNPHGWTIKHCVTSYSFVNYVYDCVIKNCNVENGGIAGVGFGAEGCIISDIQVLHNNQIAYYVQDSIVDRVIAQNMRNAVYGARPIIKNAIFKNIQYLDYWDNILSENCTFSGIDTFENDIMFKGRFKNCLFKDNDSGWFVSCYGSLHNCIFEGKEVIEYTGMNRGQYDILESFDHNQLPGNYKAWMRGGKIETDTEDTTILPGRLILTCESADYPVFRDFPVTLVAYRNMWWWASVLKDFTGGEVKMELIDPAADPLVDPSAVPLASYILEDVEDVFTALKLNYRSNRNMQAILRVSAQNNTGSVQLNTRLIEKRVKYGR